MYAMKNEQYEINNLHEINCFSEVPIWSQVAKKSLISARFPSFKSSMSETLKIVFA